MSPSRRPDTVEETPTMGSLEETLAALFGFRSFRPNQRSIVEALTDGRDVFAVMPTGGGKSLCYQLPAVRMNGTAVVVSPLISLMKDQVDAARENNIPSAYLNSSLSSQEMASVYRSLERGELKLLYVSPERFAMASFIETLQRVRISLFAVDEAHCVSEWGHDFRPDYLSLSAMTRVFPKVPVAAFTATATHKVQEDIIRRLNLRTPMAVRASFNRPNLFYQVKPKEKVDEQILEFLRTRDGESGIVYRTTRDAVERTAEYLSKKGLPARAYHAGLSQEIRARHQEAFNRDEVPVMVATIAFGMGIDKSNVRFVVHGDLPKNMEGYYQETGRGGRDGEPAHCLLFYGGGDVARLRRFIDQIADEAERKRAAQKLDRMAAYASAYACRRKQILGYFDEALPGENCGGCDICMGEVEAQDATRDAQILLSAVARTGQSFGGAHVADVIVGADTARVRELGHQRIKTYGAGKHAGKPHWRRLTGDLLAQGLLTQEGDEFPVLKLTESAVKVIYGETRVTVLKQVERPRKGSMGSKGSKNYGAGATGGEPGTLSVRDDALFQRLRILRKALADEHEVPPYVVFSDKTLREMCSNLPLTRHDLRGVTGVGQAKLERYGDLFLKAIAEHMAEA